MLVNSKGTDMPNCHHAKYQQGTCSSEKQTDTQGDMLNEFGIADDKLAEKEPEIKQRQMLFQVHKGPILRRNYIQRWNVAGLS